jgi:hypothetical protein
MRIDCLPESFWDYELIIEFRNETAHARANRLMKSIAHPAGLFQSWNPDEFGDTAGNPLVTHLIPPK